MRVRGAGPDATHLLKLEPMAREDKEQQAEARGTRMGGTSKLEILQLLMEGTVEEVMHRNLQQERAEGGAAKRRRGDDAAEQAEGMQARLLNSLKLLRPSGDQEAAAGAEA